MNKLQLKFIQSCHSIKPKLNDWEQEFIQSLADLAEVNPDKELTLAQNHKLNELNTKCTRLISRVQAPVGSSFSVKERSYEARTGRKPLPRSEDYE